MTTYDFDTQYAIGLADEQLLADYFAERYTIKPATRAEQRRGIDRWFVDRDTGERMSVELKSDRAAGRTGNAFVETISVDTEGKQGWAYTSEAQWLIYYVPPTATGYCVRFAVLRTHLMQWKRSYPNRPVQNKGYRSVGLLVPLQELERIADARFDIDVHMPPGVPA